MSDEVRIKLSRVDFLHLKTEVQRETILRMEAQAAVERAKAAQSECQALMARLVKKRSGDTNLSYRFDDATCELVAVS